MENPFLQNALVTFSSLLGLVGATVFWAIALRRQGWQGPDNHPA
jgi:hypothetical protein